MKLKTKRTREQREKRVEKLFVWAISLTAGGAALCYIVAGVVQIYIAYRAMIGQPVE